MLSKDKKGTAVPYLDQFVSINFRVCSGCLPSTYRNMMDLMTAQRCQRIINKCAGSLRPDASRKAKVRAVSIGVALLERGVPYSALNQPYISVTHLQTQLDQCSLLVSDSGVSLSAEASDKESDGSMTMPLLHALTASESYGQAAFLTRELNQNLGAGHDSRAGAWADQLILNSIDGTLLH